MTNTNGDPMTTATPRDPDSFAWGDLCDIYGTPYRIGDQYRLPDLHDLMPSLEAKLGPVTLLWLEEPPDDDTETQYVTGRPKNAMEIGGWTHYKLRELTVHRGTRVPPTEVLDMIAAGLTAGSIDAGDEWVAKAIYRVAQLTDSNGDWIDLEAPTTRESSKS